MTDKPKDRGSSRKAVRGGRAGRRPGVDKDQGTRPDKFGDRPLPVKPWTGPMPDQEPDEQGSPPRGKGGKTEGKGGRH